MNRPLLDSRQGRHAVVPPGGPVGDDLVGVPASVPAGCALLTVGAQRAGVRLSPLPQVPEGVLAVGEDLAEQLGLATGSQWRLDAPPVVDAVRLRLELPTERAADDAARALGDAGLAGRALWWPDVREDCWLYVDGVPHRVHDLDAGGHADTLVRITERTTVEAFSPGVRSGVDIVVLADCSGSMNVQDIFSPEGHVRPLSRNEALKEALRELLRVRLHIDGRRSRIALMAFTTTTSARFPREGGMVELDSASSPALQQDFRTAIELLRAEREMTDIGNALHEAAQLLYLHGVPDNDKLIVLVSDGGQYHPPKEEETGEFVQTIEEPVSLMAHLHEHTGVRLHAIGISTPALYDHYLRTTRTRAQESCVPNHALLQQLVRVGGGDPAAIGGMDVLADYFSGLGAGVTRTVRPGRSPSPGPLPPETAEALRRLAGGGADLRARRAELTKALAELVGNCNTELERLFGASARLNAGAVQKAITRSVNGDQADEAAFRRLAQDLYCFRPKDLPASADPTLRGAHARLTAYLDDLRGQGRTQGALDYGTLNGMLGSSPRSPGEAIVAATDLLGRFLSDFHTGLSQARPAPEPAPAAPPDLNGGTNVGPRPAAPSGGFRYLE